MNYEEMTKAELISKIESLELKFKDTDARGTAEEELKKFEEKHRRLIESLQDNIFLYSHNTEGVFTYISPSNHECTWLFSGRIPRPFFKIYDGQP